MLAQWFPAYDARFSRQSPGLIQHLRIAEEIVGLGIHLINLGKGTKRYKQTLKNHVLSVAEGMVARERCWRRRTRHASDSSIGRSTDQKTSASVSCR